MNSSQDRYVSLTVQGRNLQAHMPSRDVGPVPSSYLISLISMAMINETQEPMSADGKSYYWPTGSQVTVEFRGISYWFDKSHRADIIEHFESLDAVGGVRLPVKDVYLDGDILVLEADKERVEEMTPYPAAPYNSPL